MQIKTLNGSGQKTPEVHKSRVVLMSRNYEAEPADPLYGSKYECAGTVIHVEDKNDRHIRVAWDNGEENTYIEEDLRWVGDKKGPLSPSNPNISFLKHKAQEDAKRLIEKNKKLKVKAEDKKKYAKQATMHGRNFGKTTTLSNKGMTMDEAGRVYKTYKKLGVIVEETSNSEPEEDFELVGPVNYNEDEGDR